MKTLVPIFFLLCACAGASDNSAGLLSAARNVSGLCRERNRRGGDAEIAEAIRGLREKALAFTRGRPGADLDRLWSTAVIIAGWLSGYREFDAFAEADAAHRELMKAVGESRPADSALVAETRMRLVQMHTQNWQRKEPVKCAKILDEARREVMESGDGNLREAWAFFAPGREIALMYSEGLPSCRKARKAFREQRERRLAAYLRDETIPLRKRTHHLWWWAAHMNAHDEIGKANRALLLWESEHGENLDEPLFYEIWGQMALYKEGDWEKAGRMMIKLSEMAQSGRISPSDPAYTRMSERYFTLIFLPGFELQRLHALERAELEAYRQRFRK